MHSETGHDGTQQSAAYALRPLKARDYICNDVTTRGKNESSVLYHPYMDGILRMTDVMYTVAMVETMCSSINLLSQ